MANRFPGGTNERITINVSGDRFETYMRTLDFYPDTLLGDGQRRALFYDQTRREIRFERSADIFHNILFYYQSRGILSKPGHISEEQFRQELKFYSISHRVTTLEDEEWMLDELEDEPRDAAMRSRVWRAVEHPRSSQRARAFAHFSFCAILVSIAMYCLETLPSIRHHPDVVTRRRLTLAFLSAESACIAWFAVEYALRVYSTPRRWKFIRSAMGVIDLSVILPYVVTLAIHSSSPKDVVSLAFMRIIRLVRVLRILKLSRYSRGMKVLGRTVTQSMDQLKALSVCLVMAITLSSSAFYYIEGYGYKDTTFTSIPASFWFTIVTMTTVGYGDMVPQTIIGRILTAFCVWSGVIILLCLPTPVFIAHFNKFYRMMSKKAQSTAIASTRLHNEASMSLNEPTEDDASVPPLSLTSRQNLDREQEITFKQQEVNKGFLTPIWVRSPHQP